MWFWIACAAQQPIEPVDSDTTTPVDSDAPISNDTSVARPWSDDPCVGVSSEGSPWLADVAAFSIQDDLIASPPGQLVATGSSSIRRWETATQTLAPWGVVQRGIGGATMRDIAAFAVDLVVRHQPSGVLVFAGTNDIANGVAPNVVVDHYRCLVDRVWERMGPTPIWYITITPTPARWAQWPAAQQVNDAVRALSHPKLRVIDTTSAFLADAPIAGGPPDGALFGDDGLHLSAAGYARWDEAVRAALQSHPTRAPTAQPLAAQTYLRVDLGPTNPEDGSPAGVDAFGIHWNAWHPTVGGDPILAGEALRRLRTTTGEETGVSLVIAGGFRSNGLRNGGLTSPPGDLLGTLAVPEATGDFFYLEDPDDPGALTLSGLDPAQRFTLRLFASRASEEEVRTTRYVVQGAGQWSTELTTTGPNIGRDGYDGNDSVVAVLSGLAPDPWGNLYIDVQKRAGRFAYLSLMELEVEP